MFRGLSLLPSDVCVPQFGGLNGRPPAFWLNVTHLIRMKIYGNLCHDFLWMKAFFFFFFFTFTFKNWPKNVLPNFYNKLYLKTDIWGHIRTISNSRYYSCKCDFQFLPVETKVHPCQQEPTPTWKLHQCLCRHGMGGVSSFLWLEGRVTVLLTSLCLCGIDGSDPGFPMLHFWSFLDLLTATSSSDITTEVTECAIRVADAVLSIFFV